MKDYCRIYVVAHKEFKYPDEKIYVPIQVGFKENLFGEEGVRDNSNNNIADKNKNYCELTALYWIWKNVTDVKNIGICHYRRFFCKNIIGKYRNEILGLDDLKAHLDHYDIILPEKMTAVGNVERFYYVQGAGRKKDLDSIKKIITKKCPDYLSAMKKVLTSKSASYCNMLITSFDLFSDYCEWLFDILFELETITDLTGYSDAEARIYGYLSEILLNVWVKKNNLRVKFLPVRNTEYTLGKCIQSDVKNILRRPLNIVR